MRQAVILAGLLAVVPGTGLTAVAEPGASSPPSGYHFSLDGKPFSPEIVTVAGRRGELAAGDLIQVNGIWLTSRRRARLSVSFGDRRGPPGSRRQPDALGWGSRRAELRWGPDFVDGMAALKPDEVHGLWGIRAETWTRSCATKAAFLDLSRVHLTLGQSASKSHDDLPDLPHGLRYLEAMRFVGWKNLRKLTSLVYLEVLPEQTFDARLISALRHLRALRVWHGPLEHPEALAEPASA